MTSALLAAAVACAWLGCIGFCGFASPYDRLHCVTFVAVMAGAFAVAAAFTADGFSDRSAKVLLFFALTIVNGAAVAHATARATMRRGPE